MKMCYSTVKGHPVYSGLSHLSENIIHYDYLIMIDLYKMECVNIKGMQYVKYNVFSGEYDIEGPRYIAIQQGDSSQPTLVCIETDENQP